MLLIGLTGQSGAGKSTVASLFAKHGLPVIDADAVYHALLTPPSPCLCELVAHFGKQILTPEGLLNRKMLGNIVFADDAAREDLNRITHRHIMTKIREIIANHRKKDIPAAVLDAPQLFEAEADCDCNIIVSVLADRDLLVERLMRRDGITPEIAERRLSAQKSPEFFRTHSDYIILNNNSPEALAEQVEKILSDCGVIKK